jgi:hypothetical protein
MNINLKLACLRSTGRRVASICDSVSCSPEAWASSRTHTLPSKLPSSPVGVPSSPLRAGENPDFGPVTVDRVQGPIGGTCRGQLNDGGTVEGELGLEGTVVSGRT